MKNSKSRVKELESLLKEASNAYYNTSFPIMSDQDFDALRDELEDIDPDNAFLKQVGHEPNDASLAETEHLIPMGSLKKIRNEDEFKTWYKSVYKAGNSSDPLLLIQPKLDGSSIELIFENGKFVKAVTRGDGKVGEDVTHSIKKITNFPHEIKDKNNFSVRCEVILPISLWKKHLSNETKNPRNAAAGIIRRSDTKHADLLKCITFNVEIHGKGIQNFESEQDKINWLTCNKFEVVDCIFCKVEHVASYIQELLNKRSTSDYEMDGSVVKVSLSSIQKEMGEHDGRPYWARAWKFPPMGAFSKVLSVEWDVGTKGTINPVAIIDPVNVGGVTITRATLHNMDEIKRLDIMIGDEIEIIRANDVIPKIVRVVKKGHKREKIECSVCPHCNSKTKIDGPHLICSNYENCGGVLFRRLLAWVKKREIMYLGDSALSKLYDSGIVANVVDLYSLDKEKLMEAGLGSGEADRLLPEIHKSRKVTLFDLIGSLSIDLLGRSEAKNIYDLGYKSINQWKKIKPTDLTRHDGYKETSANRICNGLKESWDTIEKLSKILDIVDDKKSDSSILQGKSFCFTGEMKNPRKQLEDIVTKNGGTIGSVSKNLTYLVMADTNSGSTKSEKARKLGVKMITEDDFMKMVQCA